MLARADAPLRPRSFTWNPCVPSIEMTLRSAQTPSHRARGSADVAGRDYCTRP
jgi:hypothetical protein